MYGWVDLRQELVLACCGPGSCKVSFLSFGIIVIRLFIRNLG